jgi:hypothetical protein
MMLTGITGLRVLTFITAAVSAPSPDVPLVNERYGDAVELYSGENCDVSDSKYVVINDAEVLRGVHDTLLFSRRAGEPSGVLYFDYKAFKREIDRDAVNSVGLHGRVFVHFLGWYAKCDDQFDERVLLADTMSVINPSRRLLKSRKNAKQ